MDSDGKYNMKVSIKRFCWTVALALLLPLVPSGWIFSHAHGARAPHALQKQETKPPSDNESLFDQDLLHGLTTPSLLANPLARTLISLFERHRTQLETLADRHPDLFWEGIDVLIEALPTLRNLARGEQGVLLPKSTLAKATNLMGRFEKLASPELAHDLRVAKNLVDSRIREADGENVLIDLSE